MSILALDLGAKRCGLAVTNWNNSAVLSLPTLSSAEILGGAKSFRNLLEEYEVESLLVGLPISLDGYEHAQAARIRSLARAIGQLYNLPVTFWDERLTSAQAKGILRQLGYSDKQMRGNLDKIAAYIILSNWLATSANQDKQRQGN